MARLSLRLLGDFQARLGSGPPLRLRARKTQALLAYLASPPGHSHSRDKLASLLWGDRSQSAARSRLRETLFVLRRVLTSAQPPCLEVDDETVGLDPDAVDVDAVALVHYIEAGDPESLASASELCRGDFLEGSAFRGVFFEEWLMAERDRLRELALDGLAKLLAHQRSEGPPELAVNTALRLLAIDPLQEPVHRTLMRLYAQLGRRGAALRQYQVLVGVLKRELRVRPEAQTRQLYEEILRRHMPRDRGLRTTREGMDRERVPAPPMIEVTLTPLVGREEQLGQLRRALAQVRAGTGGLVAILGEAGIGKTRLVSEIASEASQLGVQVLVGHCYESDQILPFGPWVDAFRMSGVPEDRPLLDAVSPPWRTELTRLLPEVNVAGLPEPTDNPLRLFEGVVRLVEALGRRRPVLLVLEDLHWADEMTLRLLAFMSRRVREWATLLVVTGRNDELREGAIVRRMIQVLTGLPETVSLPLSPLSRPQTTCLVQALAHAGSEAHDVERAAAHVWCVSEGNPFVALETARALQDGLTLPDRGALSLPQQVRELILHRLECLDDRARALTSVASVIGREFDFTLLQRASGLDDITAAQTVEELVRAGILRGTGERLDFVHDRIRIAAYELLLPPLRKLLHRRVGEAIEVLHAAELERYSVTLGLHFCGGEVWEKVVSHMWEAGTQAAARSAYREAVSCFEEALTALGHLPQSDETLAKAIELHIETRRALYPLGDIQAIFGHLEAARAKAVTLGDQRLLGAVLANLTQYFWQVGDPVTGLETGQRAVDIADACADRALRVAANQYLAQVHLDQGDYRRAEAILKRQADQLEGEWLRERFGMAGYPSVFQPVLRAYCHAELGQFLDGIALGTQALRLAEEFDHPYCRAMASLWLGRVHVLEGDFDRASSVLEAGAGIAEERQLGTHALFAALGYARAMRGQLAYGLSLIESAEARLREAKNLGRLPVVSTWLGEARVMAGRIAEGTEAAHRALGLARHGRQRGNEAWTLRLLGHIAAQADPPDAAGAEAYYRSALGTADELGMRPLAAHCHFALGTLFCQMDKRHEAQAQLAMATMMYREMGMTYYLQRAAAVSIR